MCGCMVLADVWWTVPNWRVPDRLSTLGGSHPQLLMNLAETGLRCSRCSSAVPCEMILLVVGRPLVVQFRIPVWDMRVLSSRAALVKLAGHGPEYGRERLALHLDLTCSAWCRATAHESRQKRGLSALTKVFAEARVGQPGLLTYMFAFGGRPVC